MITVRVSKTDPDVSSSLGQVLRDPRYAGSDLYLRVEPGDYVEPQVVGVLRRVVVVPTEGAGTVMVTAVNETNVFNVHKGGDLEMYGVGVRSTSDEYPPLYVQAGARLRVVDCVFTSPRRVNVVDARAEIVGCRFEDSGLLWDTSEGSVRDCYFAGAVLAVQGACSPKISGTIFTGAHDDWHTFYVAGSSPQVSDCALVDGGGVYVRDRAAPEFTDVRITGSRDWPVRVYERSRADFTRLVVESPRKERTDAFFVHGDSESTLHDCEIIGSTRTGLAIEGGRLTVRGLIVEGTEADAVLVDGGEATITDLRCARIGKAALLAADGARVSVSGMSVAESVQEGRGAIAAVRSHFEVSDLRVSRWHGPMAIVVGGGGWFEDIVGHEVGSGIHSREDATITVRGMVLREAREDGLNILDGTEVRLIDADLSECGEDAVYVQGGYVTVRSSTLSGSGERGVRVGEGGVAALEDSAIRDGRGDGLMVEDGGRVRLMRCTVSGNDDEGLWAAAGASVYLEETTFSGNRGGDGERVVARGSGQTAVGQGRPAGGGDGTVRDRERPLDALLTELDAMVGQERVKHRVRTLVDLQRASAKRIAAGLPALNVDRHLVLAGPPGTGKTTVARLYGEILRSLGVLERGQFVEVARPDLVAEHQGGTRARVTEAVERARGGVLFVDGAHALGGEADAPDAHGREVVDTLVDLMGELGDELVLVLAGHSDRIQGLLDAHPGLRSRVARAVEFEDYSPDQLAGIFAKVALERGYSLAEGVHESLVGHFRRQTRGAAFDNGRDVRRVLESAAKVQSRRIVAGGYATVADLTRLLIEDVAEVAGTAVVGPGGRVGGRVTSLMARLDSLTGRSDVKEMLARQVADLLSAGPRARAYDMGGRCSPHLVFVGERGTGRSMVAGIYGELLAALGLSAHGRMVRIRAGDLVERGRATGRGRVAFGRAHGGVLLVLDAQDLPGMEGSADVLTGLMEEYRDDVVVVLGVGPQGAARWLKSHPDLEERFSRVVEFAPYSADELLRIFTGMAEEADLSLPERTRAVLAALIEERAELFAKGNGAETRGLFEECVARQARRIEGAVKRGEILEVDALQTLLPEDFPSDWEGAP